MRMIMKVRIFLAITALCLAALPAPAQEYVPTPVTVSKEKVRQNGRLYYSHVVEERQTLYSISKAYQVSVEDIYAANPSLHETGLKKDAILLIPVPGAPVEAQAVEEAPQKQPAPPAQPYTGPCQEYTVRWFDTLYGISRKFGVSVEDIMAANGLTTTGLKSGQVLRIPEQPVAAETAETVETTEGQPVTAETKEATEQPDGGKKGAIKTIKDIIQEVKGDISGRFDNITYQPKPNVEVALLLPFNASGAANDIYMDFYAGVLMGVRDLEKAGTGVKLHVHDVATGIIPSQQQLAANDFVLGPVATEDLETVLQRTGGLVPVISPLHQKAAELVDSHVNLIQAPSSAEAQYEDLVDWVFSERAREDRVIVLSETGMENAAGQVITEAMQLRGESFSTLSYSLREGRNIPNRLPDYMAKNRTNRIVVASDRQPFLSDVIRNIGILLDRGYDIVLYTPSKIRTYEIDSNQFHNAQLHISSAYFVDYYDPQVKQFLLAYRALYNTEPSQFAFQGYDTITYFARLVSRYGDHWMRMLETGTEKGLHTDFHFQGRRNQAARRVVYGKDATTRRVR